MPRKPFPSDVIKQAREVAVAWKEINAAMFFGPVSVTALNENINASRTLQGQITALEIQLAELHGRRDASNKSLWEKIKRVRAGIKASFGEDSTQYELIGGTRVIPRKSAKRKAVKE